MTGVHKRGMLAAECAPAEISWQDAGEASGLFDKLAPATTIPSRTSRSSRETHQQPRRLSRLRFLTSRAKSRITPTAARGTCSIACSGVDAWRAALCWNCTSMKDVVQLTTLEKAVRRDRSQGKAFVRFHRQVIDGREQYLAWHRAIIASCDRRASFFLAPFCDMAWTVMTPWESASWDKRELRYGPGADFAQAPIEDELVAVWKTYYASTFTRLDSKSKHAARNAAPLLATMPEPGLIPDLIANAGSREQAFVEQSMKTKTTARDFFPRRLRCRRSAKRPRTAKVQDPRKRDANRLRRGASPRATCLCRRAAGGQRGPRRQSLRGPAGQLFERFLTELASSATRSTYNTVKHYKWKSNGGRRDHHRASASEIVACRPWLEAELQQIQPQMLVCLGATAAQALLGGTFRITQQRGEVLKTDWAPWTRRRTIRRQFCGPSPPRTGRRWRKSFAGTWRSGAGVSK